MIKISLYRKFQLLRKFAVSSAKIKKKIILSNQLKIFNPAYRFFLFSYLFNYFITFGVKELKNKELDKQFACVFTLTSVRQFLCWI